MSYFKIILPIAILLFTACKKTNESEVELDLTSTLGLLNGQTSVLYLSEIDMENTPDCGKASVATGSTGATGGTGTGVSQNTQGGSNQTNNVYAIVSTFQMKSNEILNLRFNYDRRQTKGAINPQQGFSLTGGTFGNSVTGRQGTIEWGQAGINLNTSVTNQQINFMQVDLALKGSFVAGQGTTNQPNVCNTQDGVNCTAGQANTQCFTVDNRVCLVDTNSADAKQIDIRGKITCFAPTIF